MSGIADMKASAHSVITNHRDDRNTSGKIKPMLSSGRMNLSLFLLHFSVPSTVYQIHLHANFFCALIRSVMSSISHHISAGTSTIRASHSR